VPVARRVGGLADSITDEVTGILFNEYTGDALRTALLKTIGLYHNSATWAKLMRHGMRQQFGWDISAARYLDVYRRAQALAAAR
jgi:starch synthase